MYDSAALCTSQTVCFMIYTETCTVMLAVRATQTHAHTAAPVRPEQVAM